MKRALLVSVVSLSAVAFTGALAQADRHESPGSVTFAVGSTMNQLTDGSDFGAPILAQLGFEKRFDSSPFSLRIEGSGYHSSHNGLTSRSRVRSVGVALTPVYSFLSGSTRPYVIGSVGVDRFSGRRYYPGGNTPNGIIPAFSTLETENSASVGLGAGLLRRAGDGWYYLEVRGEMFTGDKFQRFRVPVTFGMRF